jgi:hypothetical protein
MSASVDLLQQLLTDQQFADAEALLNQVLAVAPCDAGSLNLLSFAQTCQNKLDDADLQATAAW